MIATSFDWQPNTRASCPAKGSQSMTHRAFAIVLGGTRLCDEVTAGESSPGRAGSADAAIG